MSAKDHFSTLSGELRNRIYKLLVIANKTIISDDVEVNPPAFVGTNQLYEKEYRSIARQIAIPHSHAQLTMDHTWRQRRWGQVTPDTADVRTLSVPQQFPTIHAKAQFALFFVDIKLTLREPATSRISRPLYKDVSRMDFDAVARLLPAHTTLKRVVLQMKLKIRCIEQTDEQTHRQIPRQATFRHAMALEDRQRFPSLEEYSVETDKMTRFYAIYCKERIAAGLEPWVSDPTDRSGAAPRFEGSIMRLRNDAPGGYEKLHEELLIKDLPTMWH